MNLPSDLQRLLPYIAVAVLAVAGLVLVVRGVPVNGGGDATDPAPPVREAPPRGDSGRGSDRGGSNRGGSDRGAERAPARRSSQAYLACVQKATDTAALERCQAFLPRR